MNYIYTNQKYFFPTVMSSKDLSTWYYICDIHTLYVEYTGGGFHVKAVEATADNWAQCPIHLLGQASAKRQRLRHQSLPIGFIHMHRLAQNEARKICRLCVLW